MGRERWGAAPFNAFSTWGERSAAKSKGPCALSKSIGRIRFRPMYAQANMGHPSREQASFLPSNRPFGAHETRLFLPRVRLICHDLFTNILEHSQGPLHANLPTQDRVFILDTKHPVVPNLHVGGNNVLPHGGPVAVANGAEKFRRLMVVFLTKIQDPKPIHIPRKERRVFHVRVINRALLAQKTNHLHCIALLPEQMAQITISPNLL